MSELKNIGMRLKYLGVKCFCIIYDFKNSCYFIAIIFAFLSIYFIFDKRNIGNLCGSILSFLFFALLGKFEFVKIGKCLQLIKKHGCIELTMKGSLKGLNDYAIIKRFNKSLCCAFENKNIVSSKHTYVFSHTHDKFAKGMLRQIYKYRKIKYTDEQWDIDCKKGISNVVNGLEVKIIKKTGVNIMLASKYPLNVSIEVIKEVFEEVDYYDLFIPKELFTLKVY